MRAPLLYFPILAATLALFGQGAPRPQAAAPPVAAPVAEAPGGVSVIPNRVVLEGRERAAEVMLKNSGSSRASFRVSMVEKDMTEEGRLADRTRREGEITAADLVRFTPRQVDLDPGETQIVRLQLRKPENLPDGEYRSHLLLQGIPPARKAEPIEGDNADRTVSFGITQVLGISIPIIVRHGSLTAEVTLSHGDPVFYQPKYENSAPVINLWVERKGNRSVIGDMKVTLESGGSKPKGTVLWEVKSVGIYTNLTRRKIFLGVPAAAGGQLQGARAKVTFTPTDVKFPPVSTEVDLNL
jgi:P pilus assembly chaperone PapD